MSITKRQITNITITRYKLLPNLQTIKSSLTCNDDRKTPEIYVINSHI